MNTELKPSKNSTNATPVADDKSADKTKDFAKKIKEIDTNIERKLEEFKTTRDGKLCYPLLLHNTSIRLRVVDDVFDDLRKNSIIVVAT